MSSLRPLKDGALIVPLRVHSRSSTRATRRGSTKTVPFGGWTPGEGGRSSHFGALVCGVMDDGQLVYVGKVGTGFTEKTLALLQRELEPLRTDASPFAGRQPPKGTVFVEPRLVARVELREWTRTGTMRAPSFKGLRDDMDPQDCVRDEGPCG